VLREEGGRRRPLRRARRDAREAPCVSRARQQGAEMVVADDEVRRGAGAVRGRNALRLEVVTRDEDALCGRRRREGRSARSGRGSGGKEGARAVQEGGREVETRVRGVGGWESERVRGVRGWEGERVRERGRGGGG
jgi:hypothetical protein